MIGTELDGRYRIDAELGAGGAGTVYRGLHVALGRSVAIKVIHPELSYSAELRQRFEREARALAALSHPHIVSIVDSGVTGDVAYLVMDLLEGETLASRMRAGPLSLDIAVPLLEELLEALSYVHEQGLVHRDVKPANVFLESSGQAKAPRVRLLDFGLAKFISPELGDPALTRAGQVFGTPAYMAPEQIAGQAADVRADIYAAGIVFFEMLSGAPPFLGDGSEVLRQHVMEDLPVEKLPSEAAIPEIVALLGRATAKTRSERFSTAKEMQAALETAMAGVRAAKGRAAAAPRSGADAGRGVPGASAPGARSPSVGRTFFRLVATMGLVVSLGGLLAAAFGIYVFTTPGRETERRSLEAVLKLPPPKHSSAVSSARPLASTGSLLPGSSLGLPGSVPGAVAISLPVLASGPSSSAPAAPTPNPWSSVPRELAHLVSKVNRGQGIDKREIMSVHQYNGKHPVDPRGHLLLARGYLNRHWVKDAGAEYAIALEVNRDAKGDPRMLTDLVRLVEFGSNEAVRILTETYAGAAVPAIDRALLSPPNPDAKSRLERLLHDLPRAPP